LMSESVVDVADVEETVTQEHVEIQLGYDQGSLSQWHNFLRRTLSDVFDAAGPIFSFFRRRRPDFFYFFGAAGPIFCFLPVLTFCLTYYQS
jgi:hypothetical protein